MPVSEATILRSLHESPDDEVTWSALADWLDEDGQGDRARLVRVHRRLRELPWQATGERATLEREMIELLRRGTRPVVAEVTNSIGMRLALIPPGGFTMGSPEGEPDRWEDEELHEVELTRPFYLRVFPVTQQEYEAVMGHNPSSFSPTGEDAEYVEGMDTSRFPVECVTWDNAVAFCAALNARPAEKLARRKYRLPTEAEWEYACRAGAISQPFHTGDTISAADANMQEGATAATRPGRTCVVGGHRANAFGLYDMHGNVDEWCADWFGERWPERRQRDPRGPATGSQRINRGGTWNDAAKYLRCAFRNCVWGDATSADTDFRVACEWPLRETTP